MSTIELRKFVDDTFDEAGKINDFSTHVDYNESKSLINLAKRHRDELIKMNKEKDFEFPAFTIEVKDEVSGELRKIGITQNLSIKKILKILIGTRYFYMTKQQLQKFII